MSWWQCAFIFFPFWCVWWEVAEAAEAVKRVAGELADIKGELRKLATEVEKANRRARL
jgi:hypothetical protein